MTFGAVRSYDRAVDRLERAASYCEITETLARYAELIDRAEWDSLGDVFTPDATFDATGIGYDFLDGLDHIKRHMATIARHPAAHLVLNVTAEISEAAASVTSRLLGIQQDGRVFVGQYEDAMVREGDRWLIRTRLYSRLTARS